MELRKIKIEEIDIAMCIIEDAKKHLKEQGIDQWQTGYPDYACIENDAENKRGYFIIDNEIVLGYLCIDFNGESSYENINGNWTSEDDYVVIHRMAFNKNARGKNLADVVIKLVEDMSIQKNIHYFRIDTDAANLKMQHILKKNGFAFCGTIIFDNSEKIAFDKTF